MAIGEAPYCQYVGHALQERQRELSLRWLERLVALLPVDANAVFTSSELLDHIPRLIEEIGKYVADSNVADIAANTVVTEHARELGQLRHRQQASVHQVLREYDLLGEVLEQCLDERTRALSTLPPPHECLDACHRIGRAVRVLMQTTVATFLSEYTDTITEQAARIEQFNRAVSHELRNVLDTTQFSAALLAEGSASDATNRDRIVAILRRNTDRALQILRTLEKLPRSGILTADTPTEQIVDLAELVSEVFRQLHDMSEARGVTLRGGDDLPRLLVDPSRSSSSSSTGSRMPSSTATHTRPSVLSKSPPRPTTMRTRFGSAITASAFQQRRFPGYSSAFIAPIKTWTRPWVSTERALASRSSTSA